MRQGQQNRRGRSRNNNNSSGPHNQSQGNNRRGNNTLSRSFESNGPDVKIRGTPAHIAEKYLTLARDAQTSGDPVLAENYLQHAEHYNRIIMAYREQFQQPGEQINGTGGSTGVPRMRQAGDPVDSADFGDDGDDQDDMGGMQPMAAHGQPQPNAYAPQQQQPRQDQQPRPERYDRNNGERPGYDGAPREARDDRGFRRDPRDQRGDRDARGDREQRFRDRAPRPGNRPDRPERGPDQRADRGPDQRTDRGPDQRPERGNERAYEPRDRVDNRPERTERTERSERPEQRDSRDYARDRGEPRSEPRGEYRNDAPRAHAPERPMDAPHDSVRAEPMRAEPMRQDPADVAPMAPVPAAAPRRRERVAAQPPAAHEQPEFLRRPVRRTKAVVPDEATTDTPPVTRDKPPVE